MNAERVEAIRTRILTALGPCELEVSDESHLHRGHAGARDGRGHFRVRVISARFDGLKSLQRHRLVFEALGGLMQTDIHALAITALSPEEAGSGG
ncbi:MAG: BolA family transcriptional regulator [Gammaproteobacteria bacterium]|nr:BolA family transcriptional regulator [Gammaproteobacteria bacterium]